MWWTAILLACGGAEHTEAPAPTPAPEPVAEPAAEPAAPAVPKAAEGARVFFAEPADGAKVKSPFTVKFGIEGMEVKPAGDPTANSGHHHLIIGASGVPGGEVVPKDETHLHFGGGQTEATIELQPGEYDLTMQFADTSHISYGNVMSTTIHITVE